MGRTIYITGAGIISAIGAGKDETLDSLLNQRSGIAPLVHLDTRLDLPCGEVQFSDSELKDRLGIPQDKVISRTSLLGIFAVKEALEDAGIYQRNKDIRKIAFISGTTVGGMEITEARYAEALASNGDLPTLECHSCGDSTDDIASYFGGFSAVTTVSTACSSAANAIILGARLIKAGLADIVVAGGSECLTKYHLNGFNSLKILDKDNCRPFDATRAGLNLGEGAGFVVLESSDSYPGDMNPKAILSGYGNACDAFHQTASSDDGEGAYLAMTKALDMAGVEPCDISYINAHGTGTPNNDASESAAIKRVFGDSIPEVSSTKSLTGHTTSASGGIEAIFCLLALNEGFIPANNGWENSDPACIIPTHKIRTGIQMNHILCNSFAFGGNDSSLLISKAQDNPSRKYNEQ